MNRLIVTFDRSIITLLQRIHQPLARISLFIVFGWFGFLKLSGQSPANTMVADLLKETLPFMGFTTFFALLGLYEVLIGILFVFPKAERFAIALLIPHFFMTGAALFLLPGATWAGFLVPTLEGQYIVKNLLIIALAFSIAAKLRPFHLDK